MPNETFKTQQNTGGINKEKPKLKETTIGANLSDADMAALLAIGNGEAVEIKKRQKGTFAKNLDELPAHIKKRH